LARGARKTTGCLGPAAYAGELRGRRPVRADHRLRPDEKAIRAQSVISNKTDKPFLPLTSTAFYGRMPFIRA
jgi:hypothetical protein